MRSGCLSRKPALRGLSRAVQEGPVSSSAEVDSAGEDAGSTPAPVFQGTFCRISELRMEGRGACLSQFCHRGRLCPPRARKFGRRFSDSPGAPTRPTPVCFDVVLSVKLAASGWWDGGRGPSPMRPRRSRSPSANGQERVRGGVEVFQNANGVDPQGIRVVGRPGLGSHHSGREGRSGGSFP